MNSRVLNRVYLSAYITPFILIFACVYHALTSSSENSVLHLLERLLFAISITIVAFLVMHYSKYLYFKLLNTFLIICFYSFVIGFSYQYYLLGTFNLLEIEYLANFIIIISLIYDKRK